MHNNTCSFFKCQCSIFSASRILTHLSNSSPMCFLPIHWLANTLITSHLVFLQPNSLLPLIYLGLSSTVIRYFIQWANLFFFFSLSLVTVFWTAIWHALLFWLILQGRLSLQDVLSNFKSVTFLQSFIYRYLIHQYHLFVLQPPSNPYIPKII